MAVTRGPAPDKLFAGVGGATVLPDDRRADRTARGLVPDDHGLALVGDADGDDILGPAALLGGFAQHGGAGVPDLLGVVLDPAVAWIALSQGPGRVGQGLAAGVEGDRPGARRALVQRQNYRLTHAFRLPCCSASRLSMFSWPGCRLMLHPICSGRGRP